MEERGEAEGLGRLRLVEVGHRVIGEEGREHRPRALDAVRDALAGERIGDEPLEPIGVRLQLRVRARIRELQALEPGRDRHGIPGQRARLVHRPGGRELRHDVAAPTERCRRQAAGHDLPEGCEVRRHTFDPPPAGAGGAEARHDLVVDEQRAVLGGELAQRLVEAGQRRHRAHIAGGGLENHARDFVAGLGERAAHGLDVVVGHDDRVVRARAGHPGRTGQAERRDARARLGEQRVDVAVVVAGEFDDLRAPGEPAREPHRRHRRLGARIDQPHLLDRRARNDLLRELDLAGGGRAEAEPLRRGLLHRVDDLRVRVPVDHRSPARDEVDVRVAVDVGELRAGRLANEPRRSPHRGERAHRRVHPTGDDVGRRLEPGGRFLRGLRRVLGGSGLCILWRTHGFQCPRNVGACQVRPVPFSRIRSTSTDGNAQKRARPFGPASNVRRSYPWESPLAFALPALDNTCTPSVAPTWRPDSNGARRDGVQPLMAARSREGFGGAWRPEQIVFVGG